MESNEDEVATLSSSKESSDFPYFDSDEVVILDELKSIDDEIVSDDDLDENLEDFISDEVVKDKYLEGDTVVPLETGLNSNNSNVSDEIDVENGVKDNDLDVGNHFETNCEFEADPIACYDLEERDDADNLDLLSENSCLDDSCSTINLSSGDEEGANDINAKRILKKDSLGLREYKMSLQRKKGQTNSLQTPSELDKHKLQSKDKIMGSTHSIIDVEEEECDDDDVGSKEELQENGEAWESESEKDDEDDEDELREREALQTQGESEDEEQKEDELEESGEVQSEDEENNTGDELQIQYQLKKLDKLVKMRNELDAIENELESEDEIENENYLEDEYELENEDELESKNELESENELDENEKESEIELEKENEFKDENEKQNKDNLENENEIEKEKELEKENELDKNINQSENELQKENELDNENENEPEKENELDETKNQSENELENEENVVESHNEPQLEDTGALANTTDEIKDEERLNKSPEPSLKEEKEEKLRTEDKEEITEKDTNEEDKLETNELEENNRLQNEIELTKDNVKLISNSDALSKFKEYKEFEDEKDEVEVEEGRCEMKDEDEIKMNRDKLRESAEIMEEIPKLIENKVDFENTKDDTETSDLSLSKEVGTAVKNKLTEVSEVDNTNFQDNVLPSEEHIDTSELKNIESKLVNDASIHDHSVKRLVVCLDKLKDDTKYKKSIRNKKQTRAKTKQTELVQSSSAKVVKKADPLSSDIQSDSSTTNAERDTLNSVNVDQLISHSSTTNSEEDRKSPVHLSQVESDVRSDDCASVPSVDELPSNRLESPLDLKDNSDSIEEENLKSTKLTSQENTPSKPNTASKQTNVRKLLSRKVKKNFSPRKKYPIRNRMIINSVYSLKNKRQMLQKHDVKCAKKGKRKVILKDVFEPKKQSPKIEDLSSSADRLSDVEEHSKVTETREEDISILDQDKIDLPNESSSEVKSNEPVVKNVRRLCNGEPVITSFITASSSLPTKLQTKRKIPLTVQKDVTSNSDAENTNSSTEADSQNSERITEGQTLQSLTSDESVSSFKFQEDSDEAKTTNKFWEVSVQETQNLEKEVCSNAPDTENKVDSCLVEASHIKEDETTTEKNGVIDSTNLEENGVEKIKELSKHNDSSNSSKKATLSQVVQRVRRRSPSKLSSQMKHDVQQKCCGHWFPGRKNLIRHLTESSREELQSFHAAKLIDIGMQKCRVCNTWMSIISMKRHLKKDHENTSQTPPPSVDNPADDLVSEKMKESDQENKVKDSVQEKKTKNSEMKLKKSLTSEKESKDSLGKDTKDSDSEKSKDSVSEKKPKKLSSEKKPKDSDSEKESKESDSEKESKDSVSEKSKDSVLEKKSKDSIPEKSKDSVSEKKSKDSIPEKKSKDLSSVKKCKNFSTEKKLKNSATEKKSKNSATEKKPKELSSEKKTKNSTTEKKPKNLPLENIEKDSITKTTTVDSVDSTLENTSEESIKKMEVDDKTDKKDPLPDANVKPKPKSLKVPLKVKPRPKSRKTIVQIEKPCPMSKKRNSDSSENNDRITCDFSNDPHSSVTSLAVYSIEDLPNSFKPFITLHRCKLKRKRKRLGTKVRLKKKIEKVIESDDESLLSLKNKLKEFKDLDENVSVLASTNVQPDHADISTATHLKNVTLSVETENMKKTEVSKLKKNDVLKVKKSRTPKGLKRSLLSKSNRELKENDENDVPKSDKTRRHSIENPSVTKSFKKRKLRRSLDGSNIIRATPIGRIKVRGGKRRGRPRKRRCGFHSSESSIPSSASEPSFSDFEDFLEDDYKENDENIPTVELDLYTIETSNDDVSILLIDPKNPNFKVFASTDAIFVGDSALGDITNQTGYISDNNNVIYVSPSHFLFPNIDNSEVEIPTLKSKKAIKTLQRLKSKDGEISHKYLKISLKKDGVQSKMKVVEPASIISNFTKMSHKENASVKSSPTKKNTSPKDVLVSKDLVFTKKVPTDVVMDAVKEEVFKTFKSKIKVSKEISLPPTKISPPPNPISVKKDEPPKETEIEKVNIQEPEKETKVIQEEESEKESLQQSQKTEENMKSNLEDSQTITEDLQHLVSKCEVEKKDSHKPPQKSKTDSSQSVELPSKVNQVMKESKDQPLKDNLSLKAESHVTLHLHNKPESVENKVNKIIKIPRTYTKKQDKTKLHSTDNQRDKKVIIIKASMRKTAELPKINKNNNETVCQFINKSVSSPNIISLEDAIATLAPPPQNEENVLKTVTLNPPQKTKLAVEMDDSYTVLADSKNPILPSNIDYSSLDTIDIIDCTTSTAINAARPTLPQERTQTFDNKFDLSPQEPETVDQSVTCPSFNTLDQNVACPATNTIDQTVTGPSINTIDKNVTCPAINTLDQNATCPIKTLEQNVTTPAINTSPPKAKSLTPVKLPTQSHALVASAEITPFEDPLEGGVCLEEVLQGGCESLLLDNGLDVHQTSPKPSPSKEHEDTSFSSPISTNKLPDSFSDSFEVDNISEVDSPVHYSPADFADIVKGNNLWSTPLLFSPQSTNSKLDEAQQNPDDEPLASVFVTPKSKQKKLCKTKRRDSSKDDLLGIPLSQIPDFLSPNNSPLTPFGDEVKGMWKDGPVQLSPGTVSSILSPKSKRTPFKSSKRSLLKESLQTPLKSSPIKATSIESFTKPPAKPPEEDLPEINVTKNLSPKKYSPKKSPKKSSPKQITPKKSSPKKSSPKKLSPRKLSPKKSTPESSPLKSLLPEPIVPVASTASVAPTASTVSIAPTAPTVSVAPTAPTAPTVSTAPKAPTSSSIIISSLKPSPVHSLCGIPFPEEKEVIPLQEEIPNDHLTKKKHHKQKKRKKKSMNRSMSPFPPDFTKEEPSSSREEEMFRMKISFKDMSSSEPGTSSHKHKKKKKHSKKKRKEREELELAFTPNKRKKHSYHSPQDTPWQSELDTLKDAASNALTSNPELEVNEEEWRVVERLIGEEVRNIGRAERKECKVDVVLKTEPQVEERVPSPLPPVRSESPKKLVLKQFYSYNGMPPQCVKNESSSENEVIDVEKTEQVEAEMDLTSLKINVRENQKSNSTPPDLPTSKSKNKKLKFNDKRDSKMSRTKQELNENCSEGESQESQTEESSSKLSVRSPDELLDDRLWHSRGAKLKAQVMIRDHQKGIDNSSVESHIISPTLRHNVQAQITPKSNYKKTKVKSKDIRSYFSPPGNHPSRETFCFSSPPITSLQEVSTTPLDNTSLACLFKSPLQSRKSLNPQIRKPKSFKCPKPSKTSSPKLKPNKLKQKDTMDIRYFLSDTKPGSSDHDTASPLPPPAKKPKLEIEHIKIESDEEEDVPRDFEGFDNVLPITARRYKILIEFVDVLHLNTMFNSNRFSVPIDQLCDWDDDLLTLSLFEKG